MFRRRILAKLLRTRLLRTRFGPRARPDQDRREVGSVVFFSLIPIVLLLLVTFRAEIRSCSLRCVDHPRSRIGAELEPAPVITIARDQVDVDGRAVSKPEELTMRLEEVRKVDEMLHPDRPFAGRVILSADRKTPFRRVKEVSRAAGAAGYGTIAHVVLLAR